MRRYCFMLFDNSDERDPLNDPRCIRKWMTWPTTPRVGETFELSRDFGMDESGSYPVMSVSHGRIKRTFLQFLRGVPAKAVFIAFETDNHQDFLSILDEPGWGKPTSH